MLAVWHTAAHYHAWQALGLMVLGLSASSGWCRAAGWLLVGGIVVFSGSLYALALGAPRALGAVTPFGGLMLILGWLAFAWSIISSRTPGSGRPEP